MGLGDGDESDLGAGAAGGGAGRLQALLQRGEARGEVVGAAHVSQTRPADRPVVPSLR